jgi:hypothetical protein
MAATPILSLEQPPPSRGKYRTLPYVITFSVLVGLGMANLTLPPINPWLLLPALYVCIALHELGHLTAGILAGFDVRSCTVGGISFHRDRGPWRVSFHWRRLLDGGSAGVLPVKRLLRSRDYAWMIAGGPIASLMLAAALLIVPRLHGGGAANTLALASLMIVAACLPYGLASPTDGSKLVMLWRNPEAGAAWIALFELLAQDASGVEPRDWDAETCRRVGRLPARAPEGITARILAYVRCLDCHEIDQAATLLEEALASSGRARDHMRAILFREACTFQARYRKDAASARVWAERAAAFKDGETHVMLWANARLLAAEQRFEEACAMSEQWRLEFTKNGLQSGLASLCLRHAEEFEVECRSLSSGAAR